MEHIGENDMVEELLRSGAITELPGASNVAYVLNDSRLFLLTGYKVLKSQEKIFLSGVPGFYTTERQSCIILLPGINL